jgi:hypothetical protein
MGIGNGSILKEYNYYRIPEKTLGRMRLELQEESRKGRSSRISSQRGAATLDDENGRRNGDHSHAFFDRFESNQNYFYALR